MSLCFLQCLVLDLLGHAIKLLGLCQVKPSIGGVEDVFAEFLTQRCLLFLDVGETNFFLTGELGSTQDKVSKGIVQCFFLFCIQGGLIDALVFRK